MSVTANQEVRPSLLILGSRGIPAAHGGFETFAERLALHLVEKGWRVTVYCQNDRLGAPRHVDEWRGVRRIHFSTRVAGPMGTVMFDWFCVRDALSERGLPLVLGYNTAIFSAWLRWAGRPVLMNMDGIEWKRAKWSIAAKVWFYLNERIGSLISTKLIADHPGIAEHLAKWRKLADIATIVYGADAITEAPVAPIAAMGVEPGGYVLSIARIEPENSILEMISAYAARKREFSFVCLGNLNPNENAYHAKVIEAAAGRVIFPGAIYERQIVRALRFHALAYCHGHTVGGTNPSLVEALGAGNPIIAHDNPYNRWVAGNHQLYFSDIRTCEAIFDRVDLNEVSFSQMRIGARERFDEAFKWDDVLGAYEMLCKVYA